MSSTTSRMSTLVVDFVYVLATSAAAACKADLDVIYAQQQGSQSASPTGQAAKQWDAAAAFVHLW